MISSSIRSCTRRKAGCLDRFALEFHPSSRWPTFRSSRQVLWQGQVALAELRVGIPARVRTSVTDSWSIHSIRQRADLVTELVPRGGQEEEDSTPHQASRRSMEPMIYMIHRYSNEETRFILIEEAMKNASPRLLQRAVHIEVRTTPCVRRRWSGGDAGDEAPVVDRGGTTGVETPAFLPRRFSFRTRTIPTGPESS